MPTYEYKCDACGYAFEKFHSIMAAPIKKCPKCGKNKVKRLLGVGAGLIFKGSGFYITDYRSESYKDAAKSDAGPSTSSDSGADKKSDTGAAASDAKPSTDAKPAASESKPAAKGGGSDQSASKSASKSSSSSASKSKKSGK